MNTQIEVQKDCTPVLIRMDELKPLEVAIIQDSSTKDYNGTIIMRTASKSYFEAFSLSNPGPDKCWTGKCSLQVLRLEAKIIVKIKDNV